MLQQILKDMFIDPELLEELSDEQKQVLFFKMREEQIRRWKIREEKLDADEKLKPKAAKVTAKNVSFNCDKDDKIIVVVMEEDEESEKIDFNAIRKKKEEEALKIAEEQARKEAELRRKKELQEIEARRKEEEEKLKAEEQRLKKEQEEQEEILRKKAEEASLYQSLKEARLQKEKTDLERIEMERKRKEQMVKRRKEMEEILRKEEEEQRKREEELKEQERIRKKELYDKMQQEEEKKRKEEEEEAKTLEAEWKEREKKAKEADQERRSSFSLARSEFARMQKLAQERSDLSKFRKCETVKEDQKDKLRTVASVSIGGKTPIPPQATISKPNNPNSPRRPPLPVRPTISTPLNVSTSKSPETGRLVAVKRDVSKPNRPPPIPNTGSVVDGAVKPDRPPRPKDKEEVACWWRDTEYDKYSGLDENQKPHLWFHGIITRLAAEKLLDKKRKGAFLVRVSERVWGYTVSFKDVGRFKHFLIDTSGDTYQFFGTGQRSHKSLNELVNYHKKHPISLLGQEVLSEPIGQSSDPPDYKNLFSESTAI